MSTTHRPAPTASSTDRPTATYPTGWLVAEAAGHRVDPAGYLDLTEGGDPAAADRLAQADSTPTAVLPAEAVTREDHFPEVRPAASAPTDLSAPATPLGGDAASTARTGARARARVYHTAGTQGRRPALLRRERAERLASSRERRSTRARHLRAALTAIALAALILTGLQLYAASGIAAARQAALASRSEGSATAASSPSASSQPATQAEQPAWVTEDTHVPYSRDDAAATPLNLPRCTTAPDTPLPCLAHLHTSPSGAPDRVVTLEEDGSMAAFVPR